METHPPARQHRQHAAGLRHILDDMGGEQDRPIAREIGEQVAEADTFFRVEPRCRLIHDQQLRIVEERLRDADAPLHAAGKGLQFAVRHIRQRDGLQ